MLNRKRLNEKQHAERKPIHLEIRHTTYRIKNFWSGNMTAGKCNTVIISFAHNIHLKI